MPKIFNVFQAGLIRGSERLPFDPEKEYFYVQHPTEGWRVYLRSVCFIHEMPEKGACKLDATRFLVVKKAGTPVNSTTWEPPKGQMEGKDGLRRPKEKVESLLFTNVQREVQEEARIEKKYLKGLHHTGIAFQGAESTYPSNTYFQYHIFNCFIENKPWIDAAAKLDWYREHPAAFQRLRRDKREKDMLRWYSPSETPLSTRWSNNIVALYLKHYAQ